MSEQEHEPEPKRAREEGEEVAAEPSKRKHTKADESDSSIPRNAIKRIMKLDKDVKNIQAEAVMLVGKATELFLAKLARDGYKKSQEADRRQLRYVDLAEVRAAEPQLSFLKDVLPE